MGETSWRKCGGPCSRNMTIQGIGPVCITCFMNHKEKPFWEKLHNKLDPKLKVERRESNQRSLDDIRI